MIIAIHPEFRLEELHENNERIVRAAEHTRAHRASKKQYRRLTHLRRNERLTVPVLAIGGAS